MTSLNQRPICRYVQHLTSTSAAPFVADAANDTMFKVNNWFLANKLSINTDKTFYVVFPPDTFNSIKVYVNNVETQIVTNCRYFGVVIDEDLIWTRHIEGVTNFDVST